jgi:hypothetical protein
VVSGEVILQKSKSPNFEDRNLEITLFESHTSKSAYQSTTCLQKQ